jgi:hypothetical protein
MKCDRCGAVEQPVEPVGGYDLCAQCVLSFRQWVTVGWSGKKGPSGRKLRNGEPMRIATAVAAGRESFTTSEYCARTGQTERSAYYTLKYLSEAEQLVQLAAHTWALPGRPSHAALGVLSTVELAG